MNAWRWLLAVGLTGFVVAWGAGQEDPLSTLSTQQQFLSTLQTQQEQNRRSLLQSEQEMRYLENRIAENEAEAARRQQELYGIGLAPVPGIAEQLQQNEAQRRAQAAIERARADREQWRTELDRRSIERELLMRERKKLLQLESEYEGNPSRADQLMQDLQSGN